MTRRFTVAVSGPGESATDDDRRVARELGVAIAQAGWVLITGGRDVGVMDAASAGARSAGGLVIGILPGRDHAGASASLDVAIVTGQGEARNNILVLSSDAMVVCGMSTGTASEIALALHASKPVVLIHPLSETTAFFDAIAAGAVDVAQSVEEAVSLVRERRSWTPG